MAHIQTLFQRPDRIAEPLHVLTTVFNSPRFRTRWELYEDFALMVERSGAILYTAEVAFGEREFAITQRDNPRHLQLRTHHELWLKENAMNLLAQRLSTQVPGWKYVATLDADIRFVRDDWDDEIIQALQHFSVLQPWTQALDLSSDYEIAIEPPFHVMQRSVGYAVREGKPVRPSAYYYGGEPSAVFYHPGYAWAYRREAWDGLGGLIDFAVLGSADNYMAQALIGQAEHVIPVGVSARYRDMVLEWQHRAEHVVRRNVGATNGLLLHHYHGAKASRRYMARNEILVDTCFNPDTDLRRDAQGLYQLGHRNDARTRMQRDRFRAYFHARREDDPSPEEG